MITFVCHIMCSNRKDNMYMGIELNKHFSKKLAYNFYCHIAQLFYTLLLSQNLNFRMLKLGVEMFIIKSNQLYVHEQNFAVGAITKNVLQ